MQIIIKNKELQGILEKKQAAVDAGQLQYKKFEEEQKKLNKCGLLVQKYKDKAVPILEVIEREYRSKGLLDEFDEISGTKIEDGKVVIEYFNVVEAFKQQIRKAKQDGQVSQTTTPSNDAPAENSVGSK